MKYFFLINFLITCSKINDRDIELYKDYENLRFKLQSILTIKHFNKVIRKKRRLIFHRNLNYYVTIIY